MKTNLFRQAILEGRVQYGTWINMVRSPSIIPLLKGAGLDYAQIDMEHSTFSIETVADMALLARALDFPIAVRPPVASREWITRLLGAGVWNLRCPQVEDGEQAAQIVQAAHYAPLGQRGAEGMNGGTDYEAGMSAKEYRRFANAQVHITVMLESANAFTHLDAIAATPGIDGLALGPSDLAQDLGILDDAERERILDEKRAELLAAAEKHGKTCSMLVSSPEQLARWREAGIKQFTYKSEVDILHEGFMAALSTLKA